MIGSGGNVDSYRSHMEGHVITECLNTDKAQRKTGRLPAAGGTVEKSGSGEGERDGFSFDLTNWLSNGVRGLVSKMKIFWFDEGKGAEEQAAAASVIKVPDGAREELKPEELSGKVKNVEGAVSGGLKREKGNLQRFFQKFGEPFAKAGKLWKKKESVQKKTAAAGVAVETGENSYLLDSYNSTGEYRSLANDRSLEGSFKVRG